MRVSGPSFTNDSRMAELYRMYAHFLLFAEGIKNMEKKEMVAESVEKFRTKQVLLLLG